MKGDFRIGAWLVQPQLHSIQAADKTHKVEPKAMQVLVYLAHHPEEVVAKERLIQAVWPDTFVTDDVLTRCISELRKAFADEAKAPRIIQTVPRGGYRLLPPVERVGGATAAAEGAEGIPGAVRSRARARPLWFAVFALGTLVAVLGGLNVGGLRDKLLGRPAPDKITSIAVLPLENLSGDPEQDYFADGMTEALITELGKISALRVISRQSTMQFKGTDKPLPEIARELNVDVIVEGAVVREGDRVRITVQVIEAEPERHLWAESYERDLAGVLALQGEVARAIAREIRIELTPGEETRLARTRAVNPEAYELYLKGNFQLTRLSEAGFSKAVEHYQQAIEKDPAYAPAYAGLSMAYLGLGSWHTSVLPTAELRSKAKSAAQKALELDEKLAEAHIALGSIKQAHEWDWQGAEEAFQRGIELNPNATFPRILYASYLTAMGRFEESIVIGKRTLEIDPLSPVAYNEYGWALQHAGQDEEALEQYQKGLELDPDFGQSHGLLAFYYLKKGLNEKAITHTEKDENNLGETRPPPVLGLIGNVYARAGRRADALRILNELKRLAKREHVPAMALAHIYLGLGEYEVALELLERAYEERAIDLVWLKVDRMFDPMRDDPRFQALLRRMNFPE